MPRRRKYRQRYDYSVEIVIGKDSRGRATTSVVKCDTPSQAMTLYDQDPEQHKIIMTPRRGGIKRSIRPRVDRSEMLTLSFDELVQHIYRRAPWTEGDPAAEEHAIENALLLNVPIRVLLSIVRVRWLFQEKRELERVLNTTHLRWLEEKYARERLFNDQRDLIKERDDYMFGNVELRKAMQRVLEQSLAKDREIDDLKAQLAARG